MFDKLPFQNIALTYMGHMVIPPHHIRIGKSGAKLETPL